MKQGWKLQTVRLSGTGKNGAGQVKNLDTFLEERLKWWKLLNTYSLSTDKNCAGQVAEFICNFHPCELHVTDTYLTLKEQNDLLMMPQITWKIVIIIIINNNNSRSIRGCPIVRMDLQIRTAFGFWWVGGSAQIRTLFRCVNPYKLLDVP